MPAATSREVLDHLLRLTAQGPNEEMADVFSEDAVFEMPFLLPGVPQQEPGREAFRAHLRGAVGLQEFDAVDNIHIYETSIRRWSSPSTGFTAGSSPPERVSPPTSS
jgi:uncharacterized protein